MTNKEIKEKLANMPKDKYIYQRYNGEITKYRDDGEYYINCEIGLAFKKDDNLFHGRVSENLIDLIEVEDYVNGKKIESILELSVTAENVPEKILCFETDFPIEQGLRCYHNNDIKTILTHELYEANCYTEEGLCITKEMEKRMRIFKQREEWKINPYNSYFDVDTLYDLIRADMVVKE